MPATRVFVDTYAPQGYGACGSTVYDFQGELFENRLFAKTLRPA